MKILIVAATLFVGFNSFAQDVVNYECKLNYSEANIYDKVTFSIGISKSENAKTIYARPIILFNSGVTVDTLFNTHRQTYQPGWVDGGIYITDADGRFVASLGGAIEVGQPISFMTMTGEYSIRLNCEVQK